MTYPDQAVERVAGEVVTDLADPDLTEIEQRDPPIPKVPVCVEGPVNVHQLPARKVSIIVMDLTTTPVKVLDNDPRRARFVACCTEAWRYAVKPGGLGAQLPADQAVVFENSDVVYARTVTSTAELSIVAEYWAD